MEGSLLGTRVVRDNPAERIAVKLLPGGERKEAVIGVSGSRKNLLQAY